ncbi:long-chain fatty acid transport protein 6 precursor, partial [Silurus asotus]
TAALAGIFSAHVVQRLCFPYFWKDFFFLLKLIRYGVRLEIYKKKKIVTVMDRFVEQAQRIPDKTFLIFEGCTYTYREIEERSNRVARALQRHGAVMRGDTVALLMSNEPDFICVWFGLSKLGCAVAFLNTNIKSRSLLHCFNSCGAKLLVVGADLLGTLEDVLPNLQEDNISVWAMKQGVSYPGVHCLLDKIEQASCEPIPPELRSTKSIKAATLYIFTSGTTGLPKAAVITHLQSLKASSGFWIHGGTAKDVIYTPLPLYHSAASLIGIGGTIELGATCVLKKKFSASQFWNDCRKYNVTIFQYIGELCRYLCNQPKVNQYLANFTLSLFIYIANGCWKRPSPGCMARIPQSFRGDPHVRAVRLHRGEPLLHEPHRQDRGRGSLQLLLQEYDLSFPDTGNISYYFKECYYYCTVSLSRITQYTKVPICTVYPYHLQTYTNSKVSNIAINRKMELHHHITKLSLICLFPGEMGLLLCKIGSQSPFFGYAGSKQLTEKKLMRDVFKKGDIYFNTGDLMAEDQDDFISFKDRVGDTFRCVLGCIRGKVFVYQNHKIISMKRETVPGHEGRAGMAALVINPECAFDGKKLFENVMSYLPGYARPLFIRIQESMEMTGTLKQLKFCLVKSGFNPSTISDPLYFLDYTENCYIPLTDSIYDSITSGQRKL